MTELREYRTVNKAEWGDGPWMDEPDKRQWTDAATGLPCLIVRNTRLGQLCGYVGVPATHLAHGQNHDEVPGDIDVHGGLTFSGGCRHPDDEAHGICHVPAPGEPDDVWWLGFDCGHASDLSPGLRATLASLGCNAHWPEEYRTVDYVAAECARLAKQLQEMA